MLLLRLILQGKICTHFGNIYKVLHVHIAEEPAKTDTIDATHQITIHANIVTGVVGPPYNILLITSYYTII